jgi:hypothetical protein
MTSLDIGPENLYALRSTLAGFDEEVRRMLRAAPRSLSSLTAAALLVSFVACGGGGGSPAGPTATPTPVANPTPTPAPTPAPTADPRAGLPPGPIVLFRIAIRTVDSGGFEYRTPEVDPATGRAIVFIGEFVVIDGNPRNGAGDVCTYVNDPSYTIRDDGGAITRRGSSNPFLLRFDITGRGDVDISARIDGVDSNTLNLEARGNNQR